MALGSNLNAISQSINTTIETSFLIISINTKNFSAVNKLNSPSPYPNSLSYSLRYKQEAFE